MSRLADPSKDATDREAARKVRLASWQRPADQRTRDQLRGERVAAARAAMALEAERQKLQLAAVTKGRVR